MNIHSNSISLNSSSNVNFTSGFHKTVNYIDSSCVLRETQNTTGKRNDLNYEKLARIALTRFKNYDRINIMPMNVSDGTEAYFMSKPFIEELGFEEFEKKCAPVVATDICRKIINKYPSKGYVRLFNGEAEELSVFREPMFTKMEVLNTPEELLFDGSMEPLYELNPKYRKYYQFGVQDFRERLANMKDEGNSIVVIRNCLRQSFGDSESADIVNKAEEKLKGASLFITGNYDRGMPKFEQALADNFVEIDRNIWARRDYNPLKSSDFKSTIQIINSHNYLKRIVKSTLGLKK